jgi:hypothetical protein
MPALLLAFAGMLSSVAGTLVGRVLLALGISFVTYKGMDIVFDGLKSAVNNNLSGLPGDIAGMIGAVGIPQAIAIVFGAITARVTISGIRSGSFTRMLAK